MDVAPRSQAPPPFLRLAAHPLRWRLLTELARSDYRVRELAALLAEPQNLVSYHLRLLRDGGLVTATRSSFDGRDSYYSLQLERCAEALAGTGRALHPALALGTGSAEQEESAPDVQPPGGGAEGPVRLGVLFVCSGNSARSPIAEALLRAHAGHRWEVASAGTRPKTDFHPHAVRVLREEFGLDLDGRPRQLDTVIDRPLHYVISLCDKAREACPDFPGRPERVHWSIPDPASGRDADGADYRAFQRAAADIRLRTRHLIPVLARAEKEIRP